MQYPWAWSVVVCLVAACGGSSPFASHPRSGPGPWRELTSEHFTVWTDTSPERARVLVPTLENFRQVVVGVSAFNETKGKTFVIAFDSLDEVHKYVPIQFIAEAFSAQSVLRQPVIVLAAESLEDNRSVVTHELTHAITFNVIENQPRWFAEGIASYFETVRLDEGKAKLDIGVPQDGRMRELVEEGALPMTQEFACNKPECADQQYYATAWALFTYLLNEHPKELMAYMEKLAVTPLKDKPPTWESVVPSLPADKLDHELATWIHYGKIRVLKYTIKLRDWPTTEKPISEADSLAAKGLLRYLTTRDTAVGSELAKSLELDHTNMLANWIQASEEKAVDADLAHSLTAAHPDDWRAWFLAWRASKTLAESRDAQQKTCSLVAANPVAVPIDDCSRPLPTEDTRRQVFMAATDQMNACMHQTKYKELAEDMSIDVDLDESGAVKSAHVVMGSPATNTCIEEILKGLAWPAGHPGLFHMSRQGPKH